MTVRHSVVSCSGAGSCAFEGPEKGNDSDMSKARGPGCVRTVDGAH